MITSGRPCLPLIMPDQPCTGTARGLPVGERDRLAAGCLRVCLAQIPDPRERLGRRHTLTWLLLAAVAAVLAGA